MEENANPNSSAINSNHNNNRRTEALCTASSIFLLVSVLLLINTTSSSQPLSLLRFALPNSQPEVFQGGKREERGKNVECDYTYGEWVKDNVDREVFYSENCPFLDPGFRCQRNGRKDFEYLNWRWKPYGCNLPRFDSSEMLEINKNKRIIFVGDSIGRNQWESLICMLAERVRNKSSIYEVNGNPITKHKGYLSIRFDEHNMTLEYYRAPFLVAVDRPPVNSSEKVQKAIRVDKLQRQSKRWVGADILVFSAGHWWNLEKTQKIYFQEGDHMNMSMDVKEGFRRSIETWKKWVSEILRLKNSSQVFFTSYSPSHYSGGTWDNGGQCSLNTNLEANHAAAALEPESWNNQIIAETIQSNNHDQNSNPQLLNITYLTEFRKDGHPGRHREPGTPLSAPEDCSHWCLPGVPDTWNELLYAYLLLNRNKKNC